MRENKTTANISAFTVVDDWDGDRDVDANNWIFMLVLYVISYCGLKKREIIQGNLTNAGNFLMCKT